MPSATVTVVAWGPRKRSLAPAPLLESKAREGNDFVGFLLSQEPGRSGKPGYWGGGGGHRVRRRTALGHVTREGHNGGGQNPFARGIRKLAGNLFS